MSHPATPDAGSLAVKVKSTGSVHQPSWSGGRAGSARDDGSRLVYVDGRGCLELDRAPAHDTDLGDPGGWRVRAEGLDVAPSGFVRSHRLPGPDEANVGGMPARAVRQGDARRRLTRRRDRIGTCRCRSDGRHRGEDERRLRQQSYSPRPRTSANEGSIPHSSAMTVDPRGVSQECPAFRCLSCSARVGCSRPGSPMQGSMRVESTPSQRRTQPETATDRLVRAYRQRGDVRARDRVMQIYCPLVDMFARRYESPDATYDELMRAGSIGLLCAIQSYVPRRGGGLHRLRRADDLGGDQGAPPPACPDRDDTVTRGTGRLETAGHSNGVPGFELHDERLQLASAFRTLHPAEQRILQLRFVDELGSVEVARRLDMSSDRVARRRRALTKLRRKLERLASGQPPAGLPVSDGDAAETTRGPTRGRQGDPQRATAAADAPGAPHGARQRGAARRREPEPIHHSRAGGRPWPASWRGWWTRKPAPLRAGSRPRW